MHTAYILNFDIATCAKMQHGTTSTIFNSTFDFVHLFLLFVFFYSPSTHRISCNNFFSICSKQRLKLSFNKIVVEKNGRNFPWETKKKSPGKSRCPTITETINGEEVTRPVNMDTCQEPWKKRVGGGQKGYVDQKYLHDFATWWYMIIVHMMIYDIVFYDDIWYRWGGCFKNKLYNWTWINMFEHVILESF